MTRYYIAGIVKEDDGSGYSVYFPDVPNVCAGGQSVPEAMENAADGLMVALQHLAGKNQALPDPSDMDTVRRKVREAREEVELPYPEDTVYQYIAAPDVDMVPVRINITMAKSILGQVDRKARAAGMTRSGFLAAAAMAYQV